MPGRSSGNWGLRPACCFKWRARYQAVQKGGHEVHLEPNDLERPKPRIPRFRSAGAGGGAGGARYPKKSGQHFLPEKRMRYQFMAAHEGQYAVKRMCRALQVSRSGY